MARVALVTGGMGGLGEAVCFKLSALGYCVVTTYSPGNPKVEQWLATTRDQGFNFRAYPCDVADYDSAQTCIAAIEKDIGPIDVLVNNAGITRDGVFHRMSSEQWSEVIRVNMDSLFNMTRQVIDGMREREWGRIINISSINGQKGQIGQTNYSAAKAGMIGFTKALALENAKKGVTVNAIAPGYIDTEMVQAVPEKVLEGIIAGIPVGRLGRGDEIADMVAFLAGEHAGYVTGSTLSLNGGQYMAG